MNGQRRCIYNGILLSHKRDKSGSLVEMWMGLESVIWIEIVRKRKYCILTHDQILYIITRMWNLDKWYKETYFQAGIDKQVYKTDRWTQGRMGGWDKVREQH